MDTITISDSPRRFRVAAPRGKPQGVDRENSLITGFSVITSGEALGHGLWLDQEFLGQVVKAGNKSAGLKARFTHPGLSGDGMGKQLGRVKNFRLDGGRVFADLHLYKRSNQEFVETVMDLAEEDAAAFGSSIVFSEDRAAMEEFAAKNTDKGGFKSPDALNSKNFPHARLEKLFAADVVDDPAANPDGFFSSFSPGSELAVRAEQILQYAFGLTDQAPPELAIGPHPERARAFMQDFLQRHGLSIVGPKFEYSINYSALPLLSRDSQDEDKFADEFAALNQRIDNLQNEIKIITRRIGR